MVEQIQPPGRQRSLDVVFSAVADPTRRAMLGMLSHGERSVRQLAEPHHMTLAGAAKHVRVLEAAGLVVRRKVGRENIMRLQADPLQAAAEWLHHYRTFWAARLDELEKALTEEDS